MTTTLLELGGRTIAAELAGAPELVAGGLLLPPGRVALLHGLGDTPCYRNGWNSWSPAGWRRLSEPPLRIEDPNRRLTADDPVYDDLQRHHSSAVAALDTGDGRVLLLGALGLDVPRITADLDTLIGWYESGGAEWFLALGNETEVFARYAELLGDRLGRRPTAVQKVWCSWYAYYEDISESLLHNDLDGLRGLPFDTVQIDDGWENAVGDWQPNAKFPSGMADLAGRITEAGFKPGLWLAPFIALPTVAEKNPGLFLPDPAGYNWGGPYQALDLTRPAAQEFLAELVHRVVHDWGYRYLKLDFLYAGALAAERHHTIGREQAYRDGLAIIREAAGDDVYLLGCGALLLPSLGLLDGLRVGPDVAPMWEHYATTDPSDALARNALITTLHRLWLRPLVDIDPDVAYFRHRQNLLTDEQLSLLQDLALLCGFQGTSDPPSWLAGDERAALAAFLEQTPRIERVGRYRYRLDGREVDFGPVVLETWRFE